MALITTDEAKVYLRVDDTDEDTIIEDMIDAGEKMCMDIARLDDEDDFAELENARIAVMYAAAYLYEHREEADHHALQMTLRALLFADREAAF